jgi:hypothetical protein
MCAHNAGFFQCSPIHFLLFLCFRIQTGYFHLVGFAVMKNLTFQARKPGYAKSLPVTNGTLSTPMIKKKLVQNGRLDGPHNNTHDIQIPTNKYFQLQYPHWVYSQ